MRVRFLVSNEDPVREMTIGHSPQREERDLRNTQLPSDFKPSGPMLQGVLFIFFFILFIVFYHQTSLFLQNLKIQIEFTILALIVSHLHEENLSLCSTLEPLYCSSYATIVEGLGL